MSAQYNPLLLRAAPDGAKRRSGDQSHRHMTFGSALVPGSLFGRPGQHSYIP